MYKVVAEKEVIHHNTRARPLSANSTLKVPQLSKHTSTPQRNWSHFQPHFDYVSIDYVIPYSIVVRLESVTLLKI